MLWHFLFSKCKNGNCIKLKHHEKYGEPPVAGIFLLVFKTSYYINKQIYHVSCNNNTFRSVCCSPGINGSKISTVIRYCKGWNWGKTYSSFEFFKCEQIWRKVMYVHMLILFCTLLIHKKVGWIHLNHLSFRTQSMRHSSSQCSSLRPSCGMRSLLGWSPTSTTLLKEQVSNIMA